MQEGTSVLVMRDPLRKRISRKIRNSYLYRMATGEKSSEEQLADALSLCRKNGQTFCRRVLGMLDRETGKFIDQYIGVLKGKEKEVTKILWEEFLSELDVAIKERKIKRK